MRGRQIMTMVLCASLFGFGGCRQEPEPEEIIDGGETNYTDANAPKEIQSREIEELEASFILHTRWKQDRHDDEFRFTVKPDGNGSWTAAEEIAGISCLADAAFLLRLQEVIERHDLVSRNGIYKVTAGLSPEYQPGGLNVRYASGETLSFTENNDPYARWAQEIYDIYAAWFSENGNDALYPPDEASLVTRISFSFQQNGREESYDSITDESGTAYLRKSVYDYIAEAGEDDVKVPLPEDCFETISGILKKYHFSRIYDFSIYDYEAQNLGDHDEGYYGFGSGSTADHEEDAENDELYLYLEYESGNRFPLETRKRSEIEGLRPLAEELQQYLDGLFQ